MKKCIMASTPNPYLHSLPITPQKGYHCLHGAYIIFATLCILYKWNGMLYMSLCLASFDQQFVRFIYIVADSCRSFILIV